MDWNGRGRGPLVSTIANDYPQVVRVQVEDIKAAMKKAPLPVTRPGPVQPPTYAPPPDWMRQIRRPTLAARLANWWSKR